MKYNADISLIIKKKNFIGFILDFTGISSLMHHVGLDLLGLGLVQGRYDMHRCGASYGNGGDHE